MGKEELCTISEATELYEKGEIKEGNYVVCCVSKEHGGRIWIPYSELKIMSEYNNSKECKQKEYELFYGK